MKKTTVLALAIILVLSIFSGFVHAEVASGNDDLTVYLSNLVQDVQPGTAGSSLKAAARAADLMKWGMNTEMSEEEIATVVDSVMNGMSGEEKGAFVEAMECVYDMYCSLLTDDCAELLENVGYSSAEYDFSNIESIEPLEVVMAEVDTVS